MEGPATELSLFDCPSIWKLFDRPRRPFVEKDAPLLLLNELLPVSATPGMSRVSASNPPFSGISAVSLLVKLVVTCAVPVSSSGARPSTWTVSPTLPSSSLIAFKPVSRETCTAMSSRTTVRKFFVVIVTLYLPGGTERRVKYPAALLSTSKAWFVAVLVATILAPWTTAPAGSKIEPDMEPVSIPCDRAEGTVKSKARSMLKETATLRRPILASSISDPPCFAFHYAKMGTHDYGNAHRLP